MLLYYNQIRFNLDLVHSCGKDFFWQAAAMASTDTSSDSVVTGGALPQQPTPQHSPRESSPAGCVLSSTDVSSNQVLSLSISFVLHMILELSFNSMELSSGVGPQWFSICWFAYDINIFFPLVVHSWR